MRIRAVQLLTASVLGLAVLALAAWYALHWTEYVRIPLAWRQLRSLQERIDRGEKPDGTSDANNELHAALDQAAIHLIRLQLPGFAGGSRFELRQIPTDDGTAVFFLCYQNSQKEKLPHPEAGAFLPKSFERHHRFLRGEGTLFVPDSPFFVGHSANPDHLTEDGTKKKRGLYWPHTEGSISSHTHYAPELYTWDQGGFVPHGAADETPLAAPIHQRWSGDPIRFDRERAERYMRSGTPGDSLRALDLWSRAEKLDSNVVRALLGHQDADVRARALSLLAITAEGPPVFLDALSDPSPRVRLTALQGFLGSTCENWRARLLQLSGDPDATVSEAALRTLKRSFDVKIACDAIKRLVERGCALDYWSDIETVRACVSPSLLSGLRQILESQPENSKGWIHAFAILVALADKETDTFLMRPRSATRDALLRWSYDPEVLLPEGEEEPFSILGALLARRSPHASLAEEYRAAVRGTADNEWRLYPALLLHAWGERGLEPLLAELIAQTDGYMYRLLRPSNRQVAALLVPRLLRGEGEETDAASPDCLLDILIPETEPIVPDLTVPYLRRLAQEDPEESSLSIKARGILARWRIAGGLESLRAALAKAESREAIVRAFCKHPEVLEIECVRASFIARIEDLGRDKAYADNEIEELIDTLAERHARSPIARAITVLERIARSDLAGMSRAALRLAQWQVPGNKERLAEMLDQGCWAYNWSAQERAELPEDLRARLAARE